MTDVVLFHLSVVGINANGTEFVTRCPSWDIGRMQVPAAVAHPARDPQQERELQQLLHGRGPHREHAHRETCRTFSTGSKARTPRSGIRSYSGKTVQPQAIGYVSAAVDVNCCSVDQCQEPVSFEAPSQQVANLHAEEWHPRTSCVPDQALQGAAGHHGAGDSCIQDLCGGFARSHEEEEFIRAYTRLAPRHASNRTDTLIDEKETTREFRLSLFLDQPPQRSGLSSNQR